MSQHHLIDHANRTLHALSSKPSWMWLGGSSHLGSSPHSSDAAETTWQAFLFNYWWHIKAARETDPTGVMEYAVHWLGPWGAMESDSHERRNGSNHANHTVALVSKNAGMPYCCPALVYGAQVQCNHGLTVEVVSAGAAARHDAIMIMHTLSAHEAAPHFPLKRLPKTVHVLSTMEPPEYNTNMQSGDAAFTRHFDLGTDFLAARQHVPQPYVLLRDGHHIFSRLRLSFGERNESRAVLAAVKNCGFAGSFPRARVLQALMARNVPVDSIGDCLRTSNKSVEQEDQENLHLTRYKVLLAFENSVCDSYITEKAMRAYRLQLVPVFYDALRDRGRVPDYSRYFPSGSYINAADFPSVDELAAHVKEVTQNATLWRGYMRHRTGRGAALSTWVRQYQRRYALPVCRLASKALQLVKAKDINGGLAPIDCAKWGWPWHDTLGVNATSAELNSFLKEPPADAKSRSHSRRSKFRRGGGSVTALTSLYAAIKRLAQVVAVLVVGILVPLFAAVAVAGCCTIMTVRRKARAGAPACHDPVEAAPPGGGAAPRPQHAPASLRPI